ncbi:MAG: SLC13 family permease [Gammaproteobacteria bacterium]|nr:SLC13 family permease [Gammaproteobacteria bacterium]
MLSLPLEAYLTAGTLFGVFALLLFTSIAPDVIMLAGLTFLLLFGVLDPREALSGLANEGMVTVGVLYIVVAGLRETGVMAWISQRVFGHPRTIPGAQTRLMLPTALLSAFMNNTPLVAALLPAVTEWGRKFGIPVSKLLLPLSYATILGGLCTLIGTSTNVIVAGLLSDAVKAGQVERGFSFFTLAWIGVPCATIGIIYMLLASRWLLPSRGSVVRNPEHARAYTVEMMVAPSGPIGGITIEEAGLRHLHGMYLAEVERDGEIIAAVSPTLRLRDNDRLVFVGVIDSVVELQRIRGLTPATNQVFKLDGPREGRMLVEAVVSDRCPLVGKTIRDGRFRTQYNAVVIAVARSGERVQQKIGDIELQAGDTLLLEARPAFVQQQRDSVDFSLVSSLEDSSPIRHHKAYVALAILVGMVTLATLFEQHPFFVARDFGTLHAAMLAAGLMLATRCCAATTARRMVDWQVLIVIAAAIGIGRAVTETGLANSIATGLIGLAGEDPLFQLAIIYGVTMLFTELLSNNTAAVLIFPIALATAVKLGVHPMPFIVAMTIAASCGFATPVGYQTNLMVYGPGGYRFTDYLKFGGPLNLVVAAVTLTLTPIVFPF